MAVDGAVAHVAEIVVQQVKQLYAAENTARLRQQKAQQTELQRRQRQRVCAIWPIRRSSTSACAGRIAATC